MTRIDRILFALSLVTANLPLGITYAMLSRCRDVPYQVKLLEP